MGHLWATNRRNFGFCAAKNIMGNVQEKIKIKHVWPKTTGVRVYFVPLKSQKNTSGVFAPTSFYRFLLLCIEETYASPLPQKLLFIAYVSTRMQI